MATEESQPNAIPPSASTSSGSGPKPTTGTSSWQGKLVGNFKIVGFLGRGAMGRVFRAEDLRLKRHVALKVFPTIIDQGKRKVRLERFIREARSAASLDHPGIVRIYEADEYKGWYYIAMELVEGGSLGRLVEANGPFDVVRTGLIGAEIGEALEFAHDHGIIHRDVKPDNIMIARGGRTKLVDFGLAFRSDPNDSFHVIDEPVGTAYFMAPEVGRGIGATPLSDQYSLAASIWYLLTGAPPFVGKTREEVIHQHINAPLPDLKALRPDVPQGMINAIEKALAKNPEDRYMATEQLAKVLRVYTIGPGTSASGSAAVNYAEAQPLPSQRVPAAGKANRGRSKALLFASIGAAALLLVSVIGYLALSGDGDEPADEAQPSPTVAARNTAPTNKPAAQPVPAAAKFVFADFTDGVRGKFEYPPTASGSTVGVMPTSSNTALQLAGAPGSGWVQRLTLVDDPSKSSTTENPDGWFVRHISGQRGSRTENTPRPTTGWIGFSAMTTSPGLRVAIALDDTADVTADRSIRLDLVPDGKWHVYQWNLKEHAAWQKWLNGDGIIDSPEFTIDSIQIWGPNADAVLYLDDITHNSRGPVAPQDPLVKPSAN